ncbi:MAG TPA: hypothetical protein VMH87_06740 [Pseudomonadales bacterium]|nr:hypothetical protein [Pseudomonadales bacterium]
MALLSESLIKIYRATRRLGNGRPVLVITGDTTNLNNPISEYYLFHEFPDMPFLYSRTGYSHPDTLYLYDFGKYSEIFSAGAMLEKQLRAAQDRLEFEVFMRDRQIAGEIFYSATALKFEEAGELPLVEFAMFQRFPKERDAMFKFSKSHSMGLLKEKLLEYPEAVLTQEPR